MELNNFEINKLKTNLIKHQKLFDYLTNSSVKYLHVFITQIVYILAHKLQIKIFINSNNHYFSSSKLR